MPFPIKPAWFLSHGYLESVDRDVFANAANACQEGTHGVRFQTLGQNNSTLYWPRRPHTLSPDAPVAWELGFHCRCHMRSWLLLLVAIWDPNLIDQTINIKHAIDCSQANMELCAVKALCKVQNSSSAMCDWEVGWEVRSSILRPTSLH